MIENKKIKVLDAKTLTFRTLKKSYIQESSICSNDVYFEYMQHAMMGTFNYIPDDIIEVSRILRDKGRFSVFCEIDKEAIGSCFGINVSEHNLINSLTHLCMMNMHNIISDFETYAYLANDISQEVVGDIASICSLESVMVAMENFLKIYKSQSKEIQAKLFFKNDKETNLKNREAFQKFMRLSIKANTFF
jgi:hypothetical protein